MSVSKLLSNKTMLVAHCGPKTGEAGGISAVIEELTAVTSTNYRHVAFATWSSNDRDYGLLRTIRALFSLVRLRGKTGIFWAHVHVSEGGSFIREGLVAHLFAALGCPVAVTVHGADFVSASSMWSSKAAQWLFARSSVVFCLGPASQRIVERLAPETPIVLTPNPVVAPPLESLIAMPDRPTTVIFAGELSTRKGFDLLIRAWPLIKAQVPDAVCLAFGPTADVKVENLPPGLEYRGNISRTDLMEQISNARIACLPSRREVLPMFVLEAMARGLAVVATPVGEMGQLSLENGVSIVGHDEAELARAIIEIASSSSTNAVLGAQAREWIADHATSKQVTDLLESTYTHYDRRKTEMETV